MYIYFCVVTNITTASVFTMIIRLWIFVLLLCLVERPKRISRLGLFLTCSNL